MLILIIRVIYPPLLKKDLRGKYIVSKATYALCAFVLVDSGAVQEDDAEKIQSQSGSGTIVY